MESVDKFAKIRKRRSESTVSKNAKPLLECPRSQRLLLQLRRKTVQLHGIVEILLGCREQDY